MISPQDAQDRCARLIEFAVKAGADAADAVCTASASESVGVRLGKVEDIERSEGEDIGLRAFIGQRSASVSTSDFSDAALAEMAERAVAMARLAPEDSYAGLAPKDHLAHAPFADLDLVDPAEPSPESLRSRALEVEDAARAVAGIANSAGASAGYSRAVAALVTSHGFAAGYESTSHSAGASMIAGEGDAMQRDFEYRVARYLDDLPDCAAIGRIAGERAVARLHPARLPSGTMPVLFDPRVSSGLVGHLLGAMNGASAARKSTFLLDRIDQPVLPKDIAITDDPHRLRGVRSRPFDGEGVATASRALAQDGRVTGWLLNSAAGRQLGLPLTGHAARGGGGAPGISTSNVTLAAGILPRAAMIAEIEDGVLLTELVGQGVNGITGDYSRGASGFRIRKGTVAEPVADFTVAGNLLAMFRTIAAADDLEHHRAINAPTLRVEAMTVAGAD